MLRSETQTKDGYWFAICANCGCRIESKGTTCKSEENFNSHILVDAYHNRYRDDRWAFYNEEGYLCPECKKEKQRDRWHLYDRYLQSHPSEFPDRTPEAQKLFFPWVI